MTEREHKTIVIPCKVCAREFEFKDGELQSPEFRQGVERLKLAIRKAAVAQGDLDIGTFWAAIHEVAAETLEANKGEKQGEMYAPKGTSKRL